MNKYTTKDSGARKEFKSGMVRDTTEGKTLWHLTASGPMLRRWAELLTRGAVKYEQDNWMKADGIDEYNRFRESAYRHFMQWYYNEPEEDHAAACFFNINGAEYVKSRIDEPLKNGYIGQIDEPLKNGYIGQFEDIVPWSGTVDN